MDWYLGATYRYIYQSAIMTETTANLPYPDMPTIIPDTGIKSINKDA